MARKKDREKATQLRLEGKSYSEIKRFLGISKSTLSGWLRDYPLSQEQIKALRDLNPRRIENFRNTMRKKREARLQIAHERAKIKIGRLRKKDIFLAGFFLYWAEGTKTANCATALANTDPAMLKFFIKWLQIVGVDKSKLKVKLHLYSDMDIRKQTLFWSHELGLPLSCFKKPYIKQSTREGIKYKGRFGQGTCNVIFENREINDYVLMGVKYLREYVVNADLL